MAALYLAVALAGTWPVVRAPATHSPHLVYKLLLIAVLVLGPLGFYLMARDLLAGFDRRTVGAGVEPHPVLSASGKARPRSGRTGSLSAPAAPCARQARTLHA